MIKHIQDKIESLKNEVKAIEYTRKIDKVGSISSTDKKKLALVSKIEVLNEILISKGITTNQI
jgi:hypothetical protein|tara:strand:- start:1639 stop:1827 length:189 start_codon:yes stop_codon:yes gene_type:complete